MAGVQDWADGYLAQARADLRAVETLQGAELSVTAMLMQMVLEKVSKAAMLRSGWASLEQVDHSHAAARKMLLQLIGIPGVCARLGLKVASIRYCLLPLVVDLERCQPQLATGRQTPKLEYPWETPRGVIQWPAQHLGVAKRFDPKCQAGTLVIDLARRLCARFEQVFRPHL